MIQSPQNRAKTNATPIFRALQLNRALDFGVLEQLGVTLPPWHLISGEKVKPWPSHHSWETGPALMVPRAADGSAPLTGAEHFSLSCILFFKLQSVCTSPPSPSPSLRPSGERKKQPLCF